MSNGDGEDTLENRIWKAVQSQPNFSSVSTDYINHWRSFLDKELASLRDQLDSQKDRCIDLFEKVSEREEVIKELIPLAYRAKSGLWANDPYAVHVDEIIEKAKSLTTKDKCSED